MGHAQLVIGPAGQRKGQVELFSHVPVLQNLVERLKRKNFNVCAVYLLDSQFMTDVTDFISGCMTSLSAMVQLELPHVNILSKMDFVTNKKDIEDFMNPESRVLLSELNQSMAPQFAKLHKALIELVDYYNMVNIPGLEEGEQGSGRRVRSHWLQNASYILTAQIIRYILAQIDDNCIQYGEAVDVTIREFDPDEE